MEDICTSNKHSRQVFIIIIIIIIICIDFFFGHISDT